MHDRVIAESPRSHQRRLDKEESCWTVDRFRNSDGTLNEENLRRLLDYVSEADSCLFKPLRNSSPASEHLTAIKEGRRALHNAIMMMIPSQRFEFDPPTLSKRLVLRCSRKRRSYRTMNKRKKRSPVLS